MPVAYYINPWNEGIKNSGLYMMLSAGVELAPGTDSYMEVYSQKLLPGADGSIKIDMHSIVHGVLEYYMPDVRLKELSVAEGQIKKVQLMATLYRNGLPVVSNTGYLTGMKAGAGVVNFDADYFSLGAGSSWFNDKKFLGTYDAEERVHALDKFFLFFLKPASQTTVRAAFTLTYELGGIISTVNDYLGEMVESGDVNIIYCQPAGWSQTNIATSLPAGATPVAYEIKIEGNGGAIIAGPQKFVLRQLPIYENRQLLYRTSLGGITGLRIYGKNDVLAEYSSEEVRVVPPPEYIADNAVKEILGQRNMEETPGNKGNTGWLLRMEAERLRDFILSSQRWELVDGKMVPVNVKNNKITFYTAGDGLISAELEWYQAFTNRYYTANGAPEAVGCPPVKQFIARQNNAREIKVIWAFPYGYSSGQVSIVFPGKEAQLFTLDGITGNAILNIIKPVGVGSSATLNITCSIICNPNSNPVTKGPLYSTTVAWEDGAEIVTNADVMMGNMGNLPALVTGSVLDNDYDPEGGQLEVQAYNQSLTPFAGTRVTLSIDANGKITVSQWDGMSSHAEGVSWQYNVRKTGTSIWTTVGVTIKDYPAGESFIYVKIAVRNKRSQQNSTYADVYVETFKDAACTVLLVVQNLTINYKKIDRVSITGYSYNTTETNGSAVLQNTSSAKIYTGAISTYIRGGGSTTNFEILPSAEYVKV